MSLARLTRYVANGFAIYRDHAELDELYDRWDDAIDEKIAQMELKLVLIGEAVVLDSQ